MLQLLCSVATHLDANGTLPTSTPATHGQGEGSVVGGNVPSQPLPCFHAYHHVRFPRRCCCMEASGILMVFLARCNVAGSNVPSQICAYKGGKILPDEMTAVPLEVLPSEIVARRKVRLLVQPPMGARCLWFEAFPLRPRRRA